MLGCQLNQEEIFFELEAEHGRRLAQHRVESNLKRPQRAWLSALKISANSGDFFAGGERLNLSAASRLLGKDRSSALRAYRELQSQFQHELHKRR